MKICRITERAFRNHMNEEDGFCMACGKWTAGPVEPDARYYQCPECDSCSVFGAEELLMRGQVEFSRAMSEE
jgi:hypothetical protein